MLDMKKSLTFQTRTFCMMNQEEKICRPYQAEISCFEQIPYRFEVQGRMDEKSCSVIFPPGYSIYIEEFIFNNPGPDNFVLLDGINLEFHAKLKWEDGEQTMWQNLDNNNPLNINSYRRGNYRCVKKLKVT